MMVIEQDKSFGYPVLRPLYIGQDPKDLDYVNMPFEPSIGMEFDRNDLDQYVFNWEFDCRIDCLREYLSSKKVKAWLNIYNRETWFNKTYDITDDGFEGEVRIHKSLLSGEVHIRLVLTAAEPILINSPVINEDYGYSQFNVPKNSVIAYSDVYPYDVRPNLLRVVSSIFEYEEDPELDDGEYYYDTDSDYVKIYANERTVLKLREFETSSKLQDLLVAAVYIPVLTELVKTIFSAEPGSDDDGTRELIWFRTIKEKIDQLPIEKRKAHRPQITAQAIFKNPISRISAS